MPELPEVETVVRDLTPELKGRSIRTVTAGSKKLRLPWQSRWSRQIRGARIERVTRRGKWILIELDRGRALLGHLGMTGQLRVLPADAEAETHTHLRFALDDGRELRFRDIRRFGGFAYVATRERLDEIMGERLGPEPWDLPPEGWYQQLRSTQRVLKAVLLDQTVVAGVGNIYADEALFVARLSPRRRGAKITREQAERLREAITMVLEQAIAARGSTIRDYVGGSGLAGGYQRELLVYGRTGEPCAACGSAIRCTRLAGRSTHWCPRCQPITPRPVRERGRG